MPNIGKELNLEKLNINGIYGFYINWKMELLFGYQFETDISIY